MQLRNNPHKHFVVQIILTCGVIVTSYMVHVGIDPVLVVGFNAVINVLWIWER